MEPDQSELQDIHSPREKYELTDELGHLDIAHFHGEQHLHFAEEENPFSYYNEINKRETISSEEEIPETTVNHAETPQHEQKNNTFSNGDSVNLQYSPVNIG